MEKFIALLRGINVGGHKKFPKADQLKMAEQLGFKEPQLYLHTGNWVFSPPNPRRGNKKLGRQISEAIHEKFGWEVPVLVLKASELERIFKNCPFSEEVIEKSYFTLLEEKPKTENSNVLKSYSYPNEEYHSTDSCVYLYPAMGAGKAKMSNNFFESKLKVTATSRNYNTIKRVLEMALG
ncbi:DUF1697 domain-containing protein [Rasiella sp. SM2506]|uniref:DUF1697 domain-containing protein n=1 Tax=Rasiella sp. SM2506 TaxID=3423914 RepID=UPI003D7A5E66